MKMYTLIEVSRQDEIVAVVATFASNIRADHYITMVARQYNAIATRIAYATSTHYEIEYAGGRVSRYRLVETAFYE